MAGAARPLSKNNYHGRYDSTILASLCQALRRGGGVGGGGRVAHLMQADIQLFHLS